MAITSLCLLFSARCLFFLLRWYMHRSPKASAWFLTTQEGEILWSSIPRYYPAVLSQLRRIQDLCHDYSVPSSTHLQPESLSSLVEVHDGKNTHLFHRHYGQLGPWILWSLDPQNLSSFFHALRKILQGNPQPVVIIDGRGHMLFLNGAFVRWLGYAYPLLLRQDFWSLFQKAPLSFEFLPKEEYLLRNSSGQWSSAKISHVLPFPENNVWVIFLLPDEIPQPLSSPAGTISLEDFPVAAAVLDEQGNLERCNKFFQKTFELEKEPPIPLVQWIHGEDQSRLSKYLKRIRKSNSPEESCINARLADGSLTMARIFLRYFPSTADTHGRFLAAFLPAHHEAQESEAQKLQLLGQLTSGVIHDFNNMLTAIMGFCDLLIQKHVPEESSYKDIEQIRQSSVRAMKLIQHLLAFSRSTVPTSTHIHLEHCLRDLTPLISRMIGPKILFSIQAEASLRPVFGDQGQLEQLFLNLAINARDAMAKKEAGSPEGTLTFRLRCITAKQKFAVVKGFLPPKRYVVVDICDTGQGISPENVPYIFDAFFSTKSAGNGTGLGLSNAYHIMGQFQGGISLDTEVGKGTTISLFFPEYKGTIPASKGSTLPEQAEALSSTTAILLVEDEDPIRLFASRALREKGHDVIEARDGPQALRFLKNNHSIRVVVTDVMMPGMDGPSLAAHIHEFNPQVKILFVSGYPEEEIRAQLSPHLHDAHFLQKPFSMKELLCAIQKFF